MSVQCCYIFSFSSKFIFNKVKLALFNTKEITRLWNARKHSKKKGKSKQSEDELQCFTSNQTISNYYCTALAMVLTKIYGISLVDNFY